MKRKIEILAPAGSVESLKAAISAGADAVYTGGTMFGARAYANNLSEEELLDAIDHVHLHGKKIYLTVNTLLKERELEEQLFEYLLPYYRQGLDAVIVQDVGVLQFVKEHFPELHIHASTQMTIAGAEGAKFFEEQGVQRVVTARELSLSEIKQISEETNVEIESFVHGALCYSYSGQCLLSSFLGGRSGNRGQCAQPCRLLYQAEGEKKSEYLLSLKDICTLELLPELVDAGIYSFKIEGRMKKPEYVAAVSGIYRKYADRCLELYERAPSGGELAFVKKKFRVDTKDKETLMDLYNRGGFHTGYYRTRNGREMVSLTRPNHAGVPAVKVEKKQGRTVFGKVLTDLSAQDVIELPMRRGQEKADTYTCKDSVKKGSEIQIPVFSETPFQKGDVWNRTRNSKLIEDLHRTCVDQKIKVKLKGECILSLGERVRFTVSCPGETVTVFGDVVQEALNQPMEAERIEKQLRKTGNTEFEFEEIQVQIQGEVFLPMQSLNELRRMALEQIREQIIRKYRRRSEHSPEKPAIKEMKKRERMGYSASAWTKEQIRVLAKSDLIGRIYADVCAFSKIWTGNGVEEVIREVHAGGKELYLILPYIFRQDTARRFAENYAQIFEAGWDGVLIRNYESFAFLKEHGYKGRILTDYNLYQFNRYGKAFWKSQGLTEFTAPLELTASELRELGAEDAEVIIYGHLPMMVSAGCVKKTLGRCENVRGEMTITDRYRKKFVVKNECDYCYNVILNQVPLYLADLLSEAECLGVRRGRLMFTGEDADEVRRILTLYERRETFTEGEFTRGHWKKGIR